MATFTWTLQGATNPTTIDAADVVQFASGTFNSAITVGQYNTSMHLDQNGGGSVDDSSGNAPHNIQFISQTGGTAGDSQCKLNGGATVDIDSITTAQSPLKINFSDAASVATSSTIFYADDGTTTTNGPTGVTFLAAEQADATFRTAEGSGSPGIGTGTGSLTLGDQGAATSHDFFVLITASPDSVGAKTLFRFRIELTYS